MPDDALRRSGGEPVDAVSARDAWARAARPILVQVARRYGALTTPNELAEEVQAHAGVQTREAAGLWIGDVLEDVGLECGARSEPLLPAFCIGPDGRIGERYQQLVVHLIGSAPADIEVHAATERLEAHRYHGAIMPVDGGHPTLPRQLASQRAAAPKRTAGTRAPSTRVKKAVTPRKPKKPELPPRPVCPTCFLQLPATGRCDNCDPQ